MSKPVLEVCNISKKYTLGISESYGSLREEIMRALSAPFRRDSVKGGGENGEKKALWALKDVSFSINEGDIVGIIGRNGAGKSTLLKIISRITEPTSGRINIRGRVATLLEVGTGFHPELTGRENIFLNGALLGMTNREINFRLDEIVAFSEIEKFLDTPVKRYSSGMYVRLAFAVAAHLEPEVLIVDEVLAVGDAGFQKKCLGKMNEAAKSGRTILFVSHSMSAVRSLCKTAVFLSEGKVVNAGPAPKMIEEYLMTFAGDDSGGADLSWDTKDAPGCEELRLSSIRLCNGQGICTGTFSSGEPVGIEIGYELLKAVKGMRIILKVQTCEGAVAFTSVNFSGLDQTLSPGRYRATCTIPGNLLNAGMYILSMRIGLTGVKALVEEREFIKFHIEKIAHYGWILDERWPGVVAPELEWKTEPVC